MDDDTSKTAAWSPADLRHYLSGIVNAYDEEGHWPHILTILTNGLETGDPVPLGTAKHPLDPELIHPQSPGGKGTSHMAVPHRHLRKESQAES